MSHPLSVAGSVVGLISLGLTICQGVISYYSAYRAYSEETRNVVTQLEGLQGVLGVLEGVLQQSKNQQNGSLAILGVKKNIIACGNGLEKLKSILENCEVPQSHGKRANMNRTGILFSGEQSSPFLNMPMVFWSNLGMPLQVLSL
ncbi:hypothetical protein ETB97_012439 [Aspergillus alliaceus]|uniref:Fungal N-terminal domain-containing protein n=1 Tax=Petromyces alliaceus TaxID=209559 RepID=A0A8H6E722_PETAA|nr:hypothetical protein ETB97_012439 [Aspergillus burnettii]